jgi:hypothetical protein
VFTKILCIPTLGVPWSASIGEDFPVAKAFLGAVFKSKPAERLGVAGGSAAVKAHAFFDGMDWEKLLNQQLHPPFAPADYVPPNSPPRRITHCKPQN